MFTATRYAEGVTIRGSGGRRVLFDRYRNTSSNTPRNSAPSAAISSTAAIVPQTPRRTMGFRPAYCDFG